jgi:hypothetical protein
MNSDLAATIPDPIKNAALSDLIKKEPVVAGYIVVWILANVGALLIGHTHLVDSATWSSLSTSVTPVLTGLVLAGLSWLTRRVVEPIFKKL